MLSACSGWQLRGSDVRTELSATIALQGARSAIYWQLHQQLQRQARLSDNTQSADMILQLQAEQWQSRSLSVNADGTTAEQQLRLRLPYRITDAEGNTLATQQVQINRSYATVQGDIVGQDKEETLLKEEMQRAATQQILQRLSLVSY